MIQLMGEAGREAAGEQRRALSSCRGLGFILVVMEVSINWGPIAEAF